MITLLSHQPIDFAYNLQSFEELSANCLQYQTSDVAMFQFKNTQDGCGFLVGIRPSGSTSTPTEITKDYYNVSGNFVTVSVDFTALGLTSGCYELCLYEVCRNAATNIITNGTFNTDLTDWVTVAGLTLTIATTLDVGSGGSATLTAGGGTPPYTYSVNGTTYQSSTLFSSLSVGSYIGYVKDAYNIITTLPFSIFEGINCGDYAGADAFDVKNLNTSQILTCEAFDFT
jgi:hypothetical protein